MDLLPYVVDLMLEVADLNVKMPDLRYGEIRLTLIPDYSRKGTVVRSKWKKVCVRDSIST